MEVRVPSTTVITTQSNTMHVIVLLKILLNPFNKIILTFYVTHSSYYDVEYRKCERVKEGLHIQATTIESVDRIGRYEENKCQPIKVLFNSKTDQTRVLSIIGNLKQAEQKFKHVFVSMDRNKKQREEIKKLVQEAKEKSEASEDTFYLVRGSPFKPLIVEIEKKSD